jgi:hypothetical protein
MGITPAARDRLDRLMDARRLDLDLTWRDVAARAGLSYEALRALRAGPGGLRTLTMRKLDRGLAWEAGSVRRVVLEDGDPVPLDSEAAAQPPPHPRYSDPSLRRIDEDPDLTREEKDAMIALAVRMRERKSREREALG